jgi:hypothetical protein
MARSRGLGDVYKRQLHLINGIKRNHKLNHILLFGLVKIPINLS